MSDHDHDFGPTAVNIEAVPIEIHGAGILDVGEVRAVLARMLERTELRGDCWWWTGYTRNGYGSLSVHGSPVYLHVFACLVAHGPLVPGHEVLHRCDNPPCWNPAHVFGGTRLENVHDMWSKGRGVKPPRMAGERQHLARLTDDQVAQIRSMAGAKQRDLAQMFGCSQSTVWRLRHGMVRT